MTQSEMKLALRGILREFKHGVEAEIRRRYREEKKLIFVKEYTVQAHFRRLTPSRRSGSNSVPKRRHLRSVA